MKASNRSVKVGTRKKVDQALFESFRKMFDAGLKTSEVSDLVGISDVTAGRIRRCNTYEEYRCIINANHPHDIQIPFEGEPETVVEALNFIGRTLTLIYNELININRRSECND